MDAIGAQEMYLPALNPAEIWQESGRWDIMGDNMFRLKDRFGRDLCLGMTHEEIMTSIARGELRSYKQLPQIWYQIQTKFRDEPRPKSGLLRVRQFIMKDSYSFDIDQAGLDAAYDKHYQAYRRIFDRCGLQYTAGGSAFRRHGRQPVARVHGGFRRGRGSGGRLPGCGYAANLEKAVAAPSQPAVADPEGDLAPEEFHTPGRKTIAEVAEFTGLPETSQMKSLVLVADGKPVLALLRGDHQLSETKFGAVRERPRVPPGAARRDRRVVRRRSRLARARGRQEHAHPRRPGAGGPPQHDRRRQQGRLPPAPRHAGRGFPSRSPRPAPGGRRRPVPALRRAARRGQDRRGGAHLQARLQVFRLHGPARAAADGKEVTPIMGSYGIGIERILTCAIELYHDKDGMVLPAAIAPFQVVVTPANNADAAQMEAARSIYEGCLALGLDALLDDRDERPGVKFKDADLIGIPWRVVVGKKLAAGKVELVDRKTRQSVDVPVADAAGAVKGKLG